MDREKYVRPVTGRISRIQPVRPVEDLRAEALQAVPPEEEGSFRSTELVDLEGLDAPLRFEIRYATDRNFLGTRLYATAKAFLQRPAAEALVQSAVDLRRKGCGVLVYDAYRPWFITRMLWDATPDALRHFVADPKHGSRHNRGAAVDAGLFDLDSGEVLPMPSDFDEFAPHAYADYAGGTEEQRRHRDLLRSAMERHGFAVNPHEWWHFDHEDWNRYEILNVPFEELTEDLVVSLPPRSRGPLR